VRIDWTLVFLAIGALAAAGTFIRQVIRARRKDRTTVEVQIGTDFLQEIGENVVTITAINRNAFSVKVIEAGLTRRSNRKARISIDFEKEGGGTIPGWIAAEDRGIAWIEMKQIDLESQPKRSHRLRHTRNGRKLRFEAYRSP
jgi:hypothetical protein